MMVALLDASRSLDGSMVLNVSRVLDVSVADFWREKHDGMEVRWGNDGAWWLCMVRNKNDKRKTLTKITALLNHIYTH